MLGRTPLLLLALSALSAQGEECRSRSYGLDSVVCVCTADYCDQPGLVPLPGPSHYTLITSSKHGQRFHITTHNYTQQASQDSLTLEVAPASPQQTILGFGSSITDSATINIHKLSNKAQDQLIRSYFGPEGIEYNLLRVPIAGTDFSTRPYSYLDDHRDLQHFSLSPEDTQQKIPVLLRAQEVSQRTIRVISSPWSPPAWMKTNGKLNDNGELLPEMRQIWADYIVRFIKEYEGVGIKVWGITPQNHGFSTEFTSWNSCNWSPEAMKEWLVTNLGPTLKKAGLGHVKLIVGDDTRRKLLTYRDVLLGDAQASQYIDGVAFHWYEDDVTDPIVLTQTNQLYPDKFLIYTEACIVPGIHGGEAVELGSWHRGELYANNIIQNLQHQVSGWIDWNLALDTSGGPNWAGNTVDAPIIINTTEDEFYKQPMFYVLGHFSKFVPGGSVAVPSWVRGEGKASNNNIHTAAFIHPSGHLVIILLNTSERAIQVKYRTDFGGHISVEVPGRAIQTILVARDEANYPTKAKYTHDKQCQ